MTPAQAGDSIQCRHCGESVAIPKLGELRALPLSPDTDASEAAKGTRNSDNRSVAANIAFIPLSLIAVAALLATAYNGIRWGLIPAEQTTESHIAAVETDYKKVEPAVLIKEFDDMEKYSLDLLVPYSYQTRVDEKNRWGWNAAIAAGITLLCGSGAVVALTAGRDK